MFPSLGTLMTIRNYYLVFHFGIFVLCVYAFCLLGCMCTTCLPGTHGGQKMLPDCQELQIIAIVWVLEIKPGSSAKATSTLTTEPIFQLLKLLFTL